MITPGNIASHELVGLHACVESSPNRDVNGMHGIIRYETKSMIMLDTMHGVKHVAKHPGMWRFSLDKGEVTVDGRDMLRRPYERIGCR